MAKSITTTTPSVTPAAVVAAPSAAAAVATPGLPPSDWVVQPVQPVFGTMYQGLIKGQPSKRLARLQSFKLPATIGACHKATPGRAAKMLKYLHSKGAVVFVAPTN
jgi:hypothetical protein